VIDPKQTLNPSDPKYTGKVTVNLYDAGKWVQVIIDDRYDDMYDILY